MTKTPNQDSEYDCVVWTDGACVPNPGRGAWAYRMHTPSGWKEAFGTVDFTTNNRMEILAAVKALEAISPGLSVRFYTDSDYLLKAATVWIPKWITHQWKRKAKVPGIRGKQWTNVLNRDLFEQLTLAAAFKSVDWQWVRGHTGNTGNEYVNEIVEYQARLPSPLLHP